MPCSVLLTVTKYFQAIIIKSIIHNKVFLLSVISSRSEEESL